MEIEYREVNGYLIPELEYHSGELMKQIGKYGFLRGSYLKEHKKAKYSLLLLQDEIGQHLLDVDKAAREREETIMKQLAIRDPLPDKADQMAWVQTVNQHQKIAEEIILKEIIYI